LRIGPALRPPPGLFRRWAAVYAEGDVQSSRGVTSQAIRGEARQRLHGVLLQAWIGSKPILAGGCSSCSYSLLAASPR
jgi:hypothetical protein